MVCQMVPYSAILCHILQYSVTFCHSLAICCYHVPIRVRGQGLLDALTRAIQKMALPRLAEANIWEACSVQPHFLVQVSADQYLFVCLDV